MRPPAMVGMVAAGAVVAGSAVVGAAYAGGLNPANVLQPQHHDVALTTGGAPTLNDSLATLLSQIGVGDQTIAGLIGNSQTLGSVLGPSGIQVSAPLSSLFAELNPLNESLNSLTGGLLNDSAGTLASQLYLGGSPLTSLTIDGLATDLLGANVANNSIYSVMNEFGLGAYAGFIDLCTGSEVLGVCYAPSITDLSNVSQLFQYLDGGLNPATTTVGTWLSSTDLTGTTTHLANVSLGTALGLTSTQINEPWNVFLDSLTTNAPLAPTATLGNETLGTLLTSLVSTPNLGDLGTGDVVTGATTIANFLTALDPAISADTINQLLGL